jgi:hypothetical protein
MFSSFSGVGSDKLLEENHGFCDQSYLKAPDIQAQVYISSKSIITEEVELDLEGSSTLSARMKKIVRDFFSSHKNSAEAVQKDLTAIETTSVHTKSDLDLLRKMGFIFGILRRSLLFSLHLFPNLSSTSLEGLLQGHISALLLSRHSWLTRHPICLT